MKRLLLILMVTLHLSALSALAIRVPDSYSPPQALQRTSFQKGIGTSTDVVAVVLPVGALVGSAIAGDWEGMKQFAFTTIVAG
ncbi:MAG: hypothetical protein K2H35_02820, partial [Muribaculaceae bacterium]|nr:hypothetical protein [Muribaculaceae bacterium]